MSAFNPDFRGNNVPPLSSFSFLDNRPSLNGQNTSSGAFHNTNGASNTSTNKASNTTPLHSKASSVSYLDFGSSSLFPASRHHAHHQPLHQPLSSITPQTVNASPSTAMAILSPPASRYAFDKTALLGNPGPGAASGPAGNAGAAGPTNIANSGPNYSNLGNDWSLNLNFSLSNNLSSSNPELSVSSSSAKPSPKNHHEVLESKPIKTTSSSTSSASSASSSSVSSKTDLPASSFDKNLDVLKNWLDQSSLEEKHNFIDELVDYFLFSPNHSTEMINYLKLKIDRLSFNDDLDSPTTTTAAAGPVTNGLEHPPTINSSNIHAAQHVHRHPPISALHAPQHSINNLDSILSMDHTGYSPSNRMSKNYAHSKANSVHTEANNETPGQVKQTVLTMPNGKDQPQVFSPLLAESGFLQNQAMRYANGNRSHSRAQSMSNGNLATGNGNNAVNGDNFPSQPSNNEILSPSLMSPLTTTSFSSKRGNNKNLSINTNINSGSNNGPASASLLTGPASAAGSAAHLSNFTSPTSPNTPGGYNLDGLDPLTRLKLQALSTINSRSKLDALKKTAYSDLSRINTPAANQSNMPGKPFVPNKNNQRNSSTFSKNEELNGKKKLNEENKPSMEFDDSNKSFNKSIDGISTPTTSKVNPTTINNNISSKNLALALKSLQAASTESAAILNNAQSYYHHKQDSNSTDNLHLSSGVVTTPAKQLTNSTLSLLSPKSPGLNSLELIELRYLNDLPVWLKNLRLHKYTKILENYSWKELVYFSDEKLEEIGVSALGARRKLLKAFDIVKVAYENGDIIGLNK